MITLITPTGGRQACFAQCEKYMLRQTILKKVSQWLVVDDVGDVVCTMGQTKIQAPMRWEEGINTQRYNMDTALPYIKGDYIFIIEDDDWYHPEYLERYLYLLQQYPVVGEFNAKYYSVTKQGYKEMQNFKHSSLCQTAIHKSKLELLRLAIHSGALYFDIELWNLVHKGNVPFAGIAGLNLCIGMKNLPGKKGIGVGHTQNDYLIDYNFERLHRWIGADVEFYKPYSKLGKLGAKT